MRSHLEEKIHFDLSGQQALVSGLMLLILKNLKIT